MSAVLRYAGCQDLCRWIEEFDFVWFVVNLEVGNTSGDGVFVLDVNGETSECGMPLKTAANEVEPSLVLLERLHFVGKYVGGVQDDQTLALFFYAVCQRLLIRMCHILTMCVGYVDAGTGGCLLWVVKALHTCG